MVFPFTFALSIPGVINPFNLRAEDQTPAAGTNDSDNAVISHDSETRRSRASLQKITRLRPSRSPTPIPLSRKRGWEPSLSKPNYSTTSTTLASTSGYLDTPAKYRHNIPDEYHHITMSDSIDLACNEEEMPPLKRRRGLAGSIISTAVSAALIGSAVGLTVYRLWRDRGKESLPEPNTPPQQQQQLLSPPPPPPPYQQGEWQPAAQVVVTPPPPVQVSPRSVRKPRHLQVSSPSKRPVVHHRKTRSRVLASSPPIPTATPTISYPAPQSEFNFVHDQEMQVEQTPLEDKMDWIGDKLSMLIEQGKRALGTEVVVMSEAKEDEVDDGSPGWEEEEDNDQPRRTPSFSSPVKHLKRPRSILPPSSFNIPIPHAGSSSSPNRSIYDSAPPTNSNFPSFASSSAPGSANNYATPRRTHSRGISFESGVAGFGLGFDSPMRNGGTSSSFSSFVEDSSSWESPEIREGMEKARSRYFERRIGGC